MLVEQRLSITEIFNNSVIQYSIIEENKDQLSKKKIEEITTLQLCKEPTHSYVQITYIVTVIVLSKKNQYCRPYPQK